MHGSITATITDEFERYRTILKYELSYVEDESFSWDDAIGLLIIQLKNTDSLNKARSESHATQIQLTSEREAAEGARKTEDFFPTLTLNSSFKSWRISIPARINLRNVEQLGGARNTSLDPWKPDSIQIRRRLLNDDGKGNGNPTLQICYGDDLMPLRELLNVDDYLVIVKRKSEVIYNAFGVKRSIDLGSGKNMYISAKVSNDSTSFKLDGLMADYDSVDRISGGTNILLYGVPGSGKSYTIQKEYCSDESRMERLVFHPDYTYSDFVGQILPDVSEGSVTYRFTPGPFTRILKKAYEHPKQEFFLIIEEINRGNAPAIFGEVFQLLDRKEESYGDHDDGFPVGTSEYGISNTNIATIVYDDPEHKVRIPSNLSIIGTMNTSDQNVFTLDTAFQRRWTMRMVDSSFEDVADDFRNHCILDTDITWEGFCDGINTIILQKNARITSSEDKRLGPYFIHKSDLAFDTAENNALADYATKMKAYRNNRKFAEKVLKYLWDDAFKFSRSDVFKMDSFYSLEQVIHHFVTSRGNARFSMFSDDVIEHFKAQHLN